MESEIAVSSQETQDQQSEAQVSALGGPRRQLYRLGKALYRAVPTRVRTFLYPIATNAVLLRRLRPEIWVLAGEEKSTHLPLSVCLYAATQEYKRNLQSLIFESCRETYLGRGWLWNAFKGLPEAARECSVVVAEVHERHLKWAGENAGMVIPAWISGYAPLPRGPAVMRKLSIKDVLRRIKQHQLSYEVTRDPKSFDDFYHKMYVPYSKARFGERAFISSRDKVKALFDRGEILMVKMGGESIVGQMLVYEREDFAYMPLLGVLDANREYVAAGAVAASYEFALQHLEKSGYRRVSLGQTQAFLNDGVLQFKRRYGHIVVGTTEHKYIARVWSDTPESRAFLKSNPLIFQRNDGLRGLVFVDGEQPTAEMLAGFYKRYFHPGLVELLVVFLAAVSAGAGASRREDEAVELAPPVMGPSKNGAEYRSLTKAEYGPLIGQLGPLPIADVIAIRQLEDHA